MIEIVSQETNKEDATVTIRLRPQEIRLGVVKLTKYEVEEILTEMKVKRGKRISGDYTVCNKSTFPDEYVMVYELPQHQKKVDKKSEQKVDKSPEPVKIKKTTTRRKKTGG